jgi:hypothetical protein
MTYSTQDQQAGIKAVSARDIQQAHPDDKGVVLIYGANIFGDNIYSYVETSVERLNKIKDMIGKGSDVKPSDIGIVLAAGRGEPPQDVRDEMYEKYGITHVAPPWNAPKDPAKPVFAPPPKYTFDDEDE